jgi:hypothetical protein
MICGEVAEALKANAPMTSASCQARFAALAPRAATLKNI